MEVDYDSQESLKAALAGYDAVVSALGQDSLIKQLQLTKAAAAVGSVRRYIPSEYGCDVSIKKTRFLPVFSEKVRVRELVEAKSRADTNFTYTYVLTAAFLDWGLENQVILKTSNCSPRLFDGGDIHFSATRVTTVADTIAAVLLRRVDETANRSVHVHDVAVTQSKLPQLAIVFAHSAFNLLTFFAEGELRMPRSQIRAYGPWPLLRY